MAAGSDLLDDVFFNTEVDEKVVSDVVGSLESQLVRAGPAGAAEKPPSAAKHRGSAAADSPSGKMGLSQQELAKTGTGVQGCVMTSPGMDGAPGKTSAAAPSVTAAPSSAGPGSAGTGAGGAAAPGAGKSTAAATAVHTVNGSTIAVNCHIPGGAALDSSRKNSQPAVTVVNNGAVPVSKEQPAAPAAPATPATIIRTSSLTGPQNVVTSLVISSHSTIKTVPTVTLVRPPMQSPGTAAAPAAAAPAASPAVSVTSTSGNLVNKLEPSKPVVHTQVVASSVASGTTATIRSPNVMQNLRTSLPTTTIAVTPSAGIRAIAPQVLTTRVAQPQQNAPSIQNIQLPPGMVLVRSESGQLLMIHQQTLAQMQAQSQSQSAMTPRPLQAPGASLLPRPVTPTTIIKPGSAVQTTATTTATALQRPPVLQNTIVLGGAAAAAAPQQPLRTPAAVRPGSATPAAVAQRVGHLGAAVAPTAITAEMQENVKKCRNFLSTLMDRVFSRKQSSETTANVKELIKNLLEAKLEPEDFTSRLYQELNSSPQPCLVPFLKQSLPALRQMTPDTDAFIRQSLVPQPKPQPAAASTAALTAVVLRPSLSTTATSAAAAKTTVISLAQQSKPGLIVPQQHGTTARTQATLAQPSVVTLRGATQSRIIVGQPPLVKQLQTVSSVKPQTVTLGARSVQVLGQTPLAVLQKNKLKDAGGSNFRDDDDINDVASMAGVNLSEESARILATNSELIGSVTRSCKDEAFLSAALLARRALDIGKKFGVSELGTDVVNYISHAAQQRLQSLLEKVSQVAQQKNATFKEDDRCEQAGDVRGQLKFFEQLDQLEKQKKEEQEREILLKAAKSRSRQEDPEQLRLKQKAKEMQQQELAQIRQREANLTALAAIGPRKKRKVESPVRGSGAEGAGSGPGPAGGAGGGSRQFSRQRITRVNLRDLLFCLENEQGSSRSQLLYKGFLK